MEAKIKTREEALNILEKLPDDVLKRVAELATNEKAKSYFSNPVKYLMVKSYLSKN